MPEAVNPVIRRAQAGGVSTARFDVDLRAGFPVPEHIVADATASAHAAGFAAGWGQGQREAETHTQALHAQIERDAQASAAAHQQAAARAIAALGAAADGLERAILPEAEELQELIMRTAFGIAEAVLGRELELAASPGQDALRRALALAPVNRPVTVRVSPADHAALTAVGTVTSPEATGGRAVTLVADPHVRSGDAMADCDATAIDARIATALDRIRQVLA